ncbi:ribokinase [Paraglaciecola chathamensis]|jgi:ribokinase|uniref:Ribokinase n=4 Tax=Paraglaciecola chathamensis TaxID=368405 RepID=A0A8H9I8U6_9ALTE|nr:MULTISPECIES: ribokinase [Paraglaciecola]AEE21822.1 PfkB domain protein [Glaciecola sp. 4H-3-7+YE-5]MBN26356.1 ribokinase [Alteromonadaceae bacterium]MBJ2135299.1 ribokinase [Paraglaciecola chathamensis]MDO6557840.1 ribokinase [Paraglaciecola chathamensis]MDO6840703.1 ribokinase [Paraglaciecola chathamensis]|tara:strand:+ start:28394 stop:29290 length:897 start_codon:yes stop_codon:yes gene_type:complete
MAVINFGSINVDHVYQVDHFVQPGETLASTNYQCLLGGKGANQSIALAKAGADVRHVGRINESDANFKQVMIKHNINCKYVACTESPSGHAIIQVTPTGENAIVLFGGANHEISPKDVMAALDGAKSSDWVLTQNETSSIDEVLKQAKEAGLKVAFNPAPMTDSVKQLPVDCIDLLIVNEVEAEEISGHKDIDAMEKYFHANWPNCEIIITLGKAGVCMLKNERRIEVDAFVVDAVDTTAAGDTFIGFFLSAYSEHTDAKTALTRACAASALAVTQVGAAQSIPDEEQVNRFLAKHHS